ncbi:MAG TPA: hypothetical protein VLW26_07315 [Steroidobacteraceae bacterium]|nr:hypothetical protein [Steroidobacteraceae bacterium]
MRRSLLIVAIGWLSLAAGCMNAPDGSGKSNAVNGNVTPAPSGGASTVNGSIHVPAGQPSGNVSTVNGSIQIDPNAQVENAAAVNGGISVGAHATASALNTVNGGISLEEGARVGKTVTSVNGTLTLQDGADITGALANVNGRISLTAAHVGGGIKTVNGDIDVGKNSHVEGGIHVEKAGNSWFGGGGSGTPPRIVIGPGAVVQGDLRFDREVKLYVSDTAQIGQVIGATAVKFSGDNPPS